MVVKKRMLLWDWTNTKNCPKQIEKVHFGGPISSVCNWNSWVPPELKGRCQFRPMVHLMPQLSGQEWHNIESSSEPIILYFNEPERAGISPATAADLWFKQMVPLRQKKGKKLCSPSCSNDDAGQRWIADFMNRGASAPPDFLGLHYYGTSGDGAIRFIQGMHAKHPHQKIMVTEIASIDRNYASVLGFTRHLCNWMDSTDYISEYAFFGCMEHPADGFVSPAAQLMNVDGSFRDLMYKLMWDQPIRA